MARRRTHTDHEAAAQPGEHAEGLEEHAGSVVPKAADLWIEAQTRLFERVDEVARRWLDRRREALDATRQSMDEMRRSNDIAELVRIQQEWVLGAVHRLTADVAELTGAALTFAQISAARIGRASEGMAYDLERAGQESLSAAGSKPGLRTEE